jgi:hypothetical protein
LSRGPFSYISPSPNGKSLALLTDAGLLWVVSSDFQRPLAEFDTTTAGAMDGEKVMQVEWCGNDAILVVWETISILVGPFGDVLRSVVVELGLIKPTDAFSGTTMVDLCMPLQNKTA